MPWTKEQQSAIDARNHTILVSTAAGSGKTAVLVERIVGLIREGYRMERMLIVTFTRAAAAEMRQRLNQRIAKEAQNDPEHMTQALDDLEAAEISTIHAFCQK
ncbi:MAG: UvrD-helicase domain-containing protein, partial [Clostridia bacterium]|nr:UvrD-helicase domain-containing protein [Clostridia bacterium]